MSSEQDGEGRRAGRSRPAGSLFRYASAALGAAFVGLNAAYFSHADGARLGQDSAVYLNGADSLRGGEELSSRQLLAGGYVALLAAAKSLGITLDWMVVLQVLVAGLAGFALFDLGRRLGGRWVGLGGAALFVAVPEFTAWNTYILTDSLYISLVILSVWAVVRAVGGSWRAYAGASALLLATAAIRPNGWLVVAVAAVYWVSAMSAGRRRRVAGAGLTLLALAGCAVVVASEAALNPAQTLRGGVVMYRQQIDMPSEPRGDGLAGAVEYAFHHPLETLRLCSERVGVELLHARAAYSFPHKLLIAVWLSTLYALALVGFVSARRHRLTKLVAAVAVLHLVGVAGSFADYDGRYLLYVLPLVGLMSAYGLATIAGALSARRPALPREAPHRGSAAGSP